MIELAAEAASTVQGEAASIGPAVEADPVIWTARLRTGRVVMFRASGSRAFRAAALIDSVAVEDSAVTALVAADLVAAVTALGSEAGAENKCLESPIYFINSRVNKTPKGEYMRKV